MKMALIKLVASLLVAGAIVWWATSIEMVRPFLTEHWFFVTLGLGAYFWLGILKGARSGTGGGGSSSRSSCTSCDGRGWRTCPQCGGTGQASFSALCGLCKGTCQVRCFSCTGRSPW